MSMRFGAGMVRGFGALCALMACSANDASDKGLGGGAAMGSGASGSASGSTTGAGATPGVVVPEGGSGGVKGCIELEVKSEPVTPTVVLVVDGSSSMWQPRADLWDPLYAALMTPVTGVVPSLQDRVRFGFTSYRRKTQPADATCPFLTTVDIALDNSDAIDATYTQLGSEWVDGVKWETPTGESIAQVAATLAAYNPEPPGPKYMLLVTDGNPDTCAVSDPQCGQDVTIKAVQDAHAQGIGTFVVGIGNVVLNNDGCPASARCGVDHLQDIANAGQGLAVQAPPANFVYEACNAGALEGTYAGDTETPGAAEYFTPAGPEALKSAVEGLLNSIAKCTFDMDVEVTGDAAAGSVRLVNPDADISLAYQDANGWTLEDNRYQVTVRGSACETLRAGQHELKISFPCEEAVPR